MRGQKLKQDAITNVVGGFVVAGTLMWVIRIAGAVFEPALLGFFLLARRMSGLGAHLFQLGMSQTLYRYLPINTDNASSRRGYLSFAALVWLGEVVLFVPLGYALRRSLGEWWFPGMEGNALLGFCVVLLGLSSIIHYVVTPILFAARRILLAKVVDLFNMGGSLLFLFLVLRERATPSSALGFQALANIAVTLAILGISLSRLRGAPWPDRETRRGIRLDFVRYGLPRSVITFLDMGLWVVGPWLLRHNPDEAGFLIIALTINRLIQMFVLPITKLASVVTARYVGLGDEASIQEGVRLVFGLAVYVSVLAMAAIAPWGDQIHHIWLSTPQLAEGASRWFVWVCWGIVPVTVLHALMGIIEVRWVVPLNLYTLLAGFGAQGVFYYTFRSYLGTSEAVGISLVVMFWVGGLMTVWWIVGDLRPLSYFGFMRLGIATGLIGLSNVCAEMTGSIWAAVLALVFTGLVIALLVTVSPSRFMRDVLVWVKLPASSSEA